MKSKFATLFLPLVAATLHPKENNNNSIFLYDPPQLRWNKSDLSDFVRELRHMAISDRSFSKAVNVEKILMRSKYNMDRNDDYYKLLSEIIVHLFEECGCYGLELGGALLKLFESIEDDTLTKLYPHLLKSENSEIKLFALSKAGIDEVIWKEYFPTIENDTHAQKRLLELIDMKDLSRGMKLLKNWEESLREPGKNFEYRSSLEFLKCWYMEHSFPFYVRFCLQQRKMRPAEVIKEFMYTESFKEYLYSLADVQYFPLGGIDFNVKLALLTHQMKDDSEENIISKLEFKEDDFDGKMALLKSTIKNGPVSSDFKGLVLKKVDFGKIHLLSDEIIEKILRSGFVEALSGCFSYEIPLSQRSVMKLGVVAARFLVEIVRSPTKYSWVNPRAAESLLKTVLKAIKSCRISFKVDSPITEALDFAFEDGILIEFYSRYKASDSKYLVRLISNFYSHETKLFFASKKCIGNEDSSQLDQHSPFYELYNSIVIPNHWKYIFSDVVRRKKRYAKEN